MKNVMVVLAAFILVLTVSSCGKESALWPDSVLAIEQQAVANQDPAPLDFRRSADTTLQLTAKRATLDTNANTYTVHFDRDCTGDVQGLSAQQQLDFTDEQQQAQQVTMQPQSFTQTSTELEVVFDYGSADLTGLDLSSTQAIIVEEIILN